jgi:hypothetical protein
VHSCSRLVNANNNAVWSCKNFGSNAGRGALSRACHEPVTALLCMLPACGCLCRGESKLDMAVDGRANRDDEAGEDQYGLLFGLVGQLMMRRLSSSQQLMQPEALAEGEKSLFVLDSDPGGP